MAWRVVGLLVLIVTMLAPGWVEASDPSTRLASPESARVRAASPELGARYEPLDHLEGGACGDEEEEPEELIRCGSEISFFELPGLLGVLRESIERMTPGQCRKLLDDLYEREACQFGGRECGDLLPLGLPPIAPKSMSSSSSSAHAWLERLAVMPATTLVGPRAANDRMPHVRSIAPLERPPRSNALG